MVKELKGKTLEEQLTLLSLFRLRGDLITGCSFLKVGSREGVEILISCLWGQVTGRKEME